MIHPLITWSHLFPEDSCLEVRYCCQLYVSLPYFLAEHTTWVWWWLSSHFSAVVNCSYSARLQGIPECTPYTKKPHPTASHKSSRVSMAFFNLLARKVLWYQWSQRHRSHQGTWFAHYKESCCAITSVLGHFQSYSPNELCLPMVYTEVAPTNSEIHILGWKLIF